MPYVGQPVKRFEDAPLVTGQGRFLDDVSLPGMLYAAMVRSDYAHARIRSVDTSAARDLPGVVEVLVASDIAGTLEDIPSRPIAGEKMGLLRRATQQFHWINRAYADFDAFLATLSSRKRKAIRKERRVAQGFGGTIRMLRGDDIRPEHWDAFWTFYQDTGARKWGTPYLTRAAFDLISERMGERVLLVLALKDGEPIAGALNFIGGEALYGRYWGCTREVRFLHFELCYYQAIDAAIARGLARVEAGAQGGHKLARGYAPVQTHSAHYIADPGLRAAVAEFLERERQGIAVEQNFLEARTPFRKG